MADLKFLRSLLALLAVQAICAGRHVVISRLERSPLGVGIRSALRENAYYSSWSRQRRQQTSRSNLFSHVNLCSEHESSAQSASSEDHHHSRFASVSQDEAEALGLVLPPHLRVRRDNKVGRSRDEFECLEKGLVPCSTAYRKIEPEDYRVIQVTRRGSAASAKSFEDDGSNVVQTSDTRGGNVLAVRGLLFWENMVCGAISRSVAQTVMHPANTMKTILQSARGVDRPTLGQLMQPQMFRTLTRGAWANFVLSVPHGAVNFAVLEFVRGRLSKVVESIPYLEERAGSIGPGLDFLSSAISTICCSIVSTPQMMITDNIMAGNYPRLSAAVSGLYSERGIMGFYTGWWPGLAGKIPSYALTWTFFQQLKRIRDHMSDHPATNIENTIMGCIASGTCVCIMIPLDTIKTRLVTQTSKAVTTGVPYKGIIDCALRMTREEGVRAFYRGLAPRLISVVPMIGIQFGVYEAMKKLMLHRMPPQVPNKVQEVEEVVDLYEYGEEETLEEAAMEVAASSSSPFPAPHFLKKIAKAKEDKLKRVRGT